MKNLISQQWNSVRVGLFIANRQIRANMGTTLLIIAVMTLTYLNLLVVSGLMVGIVEGLRNERLQYQTGDMTISNYPDQTSIPNSPRIISYLRAMPEVSSLSARYATDGVLKANYTDSRPVGVHPDVIVARIAGINPDDETQTTHLSNLLIEGSFLQPGDYDQVVVGASLLARYKALWAVPGRMPLPQVGVGSKIRILVGGIEREVTIKGVVASKLEEIVLRVYMVDEQLRSFLGRDDHGVNEIAVRFAPHTDADAVKATLIQAGFAENANIELALQSEPGLVQDFSRTFNQLGTVLGSIGLIISFIVIFILVFINTVVRRRSIGILQALGIQSSGIEFAYIIQSILYALAGSLIGMFLLFAVLEPYFILHPIDFPYSNGVLAVDLPEALLKSGVLLVAIMLASFIPARMIMRQEIVDAILGR